jgi:hypothetical protein
MTLPATTILDADAVRIILWLLSQPLLWAAAGVTVGPYLFYRGFVALQLKRRIMNIPRSTVRSAAMGPVEICGKAIGPYTLVAPLSQSECFYYRLMVESNPRGDLGSRVHEMCAPLFLDDGTGILMVYPCGSDLRLKSSGGRAEYGKALAVLTSRYYAETPEFSQEYSIKPGETIFVLGTLQENRWRNRPKLEDWDDEMARIGPGFVGEAEADFLRRQVFQFLDPAVPSGATIETQQAFDLNPPAILTKGSTPFIIANDSERQLLTKLSLTSLLFIWGGPVATLWGVWELLFVKPGLIGSPFFGR